MKRKDVLIVEDAEDQAQLLRRWLELAGFAVTVARDGAGGLALCRRAEFDIVISDLEMPLSRGVAVVEWSKQTFPDRPIIVTTAVQRIEDVDGAALTFADAVILKPLSRSSVVAIVAALYESSAEWRRSRGLRDALERATLPGSQSRSAP
jgi:DNA-binding response OmpR family regulator